MKKYSEMFKNLSMVTQLGLSLIMPVLLCLFLCWLLVSKTGVGTWVYIVGFFFGLGGSAMTAYKVWHAVTKDEKKSEGDAEEDPDGKGTGQSAKRRGIGFNEHL